METFGVLKLRTAVNPVLDQAVDRAADHFFLFDRAVAPAMSPAENRPGIRKMVFKCGVFQTWGWLGRKAQGWR